MKTRPHVSLSWGIAFVLAGIWVLATALPFLFMVINSFKGQFEMLKKGIFQLPDSWYPENYIDIMQKGFANYFFHSVIVLVVSLSILLFITACAAYPLSRMDFRGRAPSSR
jgi:raffinose/stachyose/melibiose transport system permease protein